MGQNVVKILIFRKFSDFGKTHIQRFSTSLTLFDLAQFLDLDNNRHYQLAWSIVGVCNQLFWICTVLKVCLYTATTLVSVPLTLSLDISFQINLFQPSLISFFQVTLIFWTFIHVLKHIWSTWFHGSTKIILNDDVSIINDVIHHVTGTQLHVLDWTNGILVKFYKFLSQPHDVSILFWVPMWPIINHNLLILNWYLPKSASGRIDSWDADLSYFLGGIMGRGTGEIAKAMNFIKFKIHRKFWFHLTYYNNKKLQ